MMPPEYDTIPHRRFNLLTGEWVLVSPQRTRRPWQGQTEATEAPPVAAYDPTCYLCPGNERAAGARNPEYSQPFVFTNDFPALLPDLPRLPDRPGPLLQAQAEPGVCRVVCYSPRHDLSFGQMPPQQAVAVIDTWRREYVELGALPWINAVQIFENRGTAMGCSNPHPHGQIWANATVPTIPAREGERQEDFFRERGKCLLCASLAEELADPVRVVMANNHFVVLVPFWAVWPFETLLLPRRHDSRITGLGPEEKEALAEIMIRLNVCYDNLFATVFPYSMGIHQQPTDGCEHPEWHWHVHYYPPLLRSAAVRKHMVGYEMMAMPQRDLTAERCAERLRAVPVDRHFRERGEQR
ncbi:MAG: UDP-glucose--hexose-1-phosphate uridylyltransferase [Desulfobulbaceae bacterium]|nr:MAG: UDP-glucose--hexose-1-phosphate uridylyltransferase [Desulfobulbaceae bacterium]